MNTFTLEEALAGIDSFIEERRNAAMESATTNDEENTVEESSVEEEIDYDAERLATYEAFEAGDITSEEKAERLAMLEEACKGKKCCPKCGKENCECNDADDEAEEGCCKESAEEFLDRYLESSDDEDEGEAVTEGTDSDALKKFRESKTTIKTKISSAKKNIKAGNNAEAKKDIKAARKEVSNMRDYIKVLPESQLGNAASILGNMIMGARAGLGARDMAILGKGVSDLSKLNKSTNLIGNKGAAVDQIVRDTANKSNDRKGRAIASGIGAVAGGAALTAANKKDYGTIDNIRVKMLKALDKFDKQLSKLESKM